MKTITVDDFTCLEFEAIKNSLGTYGTRPPGIPFGYDDTATLQRIIAGYKQYLEIKKLVIL